MQFPFVGMYTGAGAVVLGLEFLAIPFCGNEEFKRIVEEAKSKPIEVSQVRDIDSELNEIIERAKEEARRLKENVLAQLEEYVEMIVEEVLKVE